MSEATRFSGHLTEELCDDAAAGLLSHSELKTVGNHVRACEPCETLLQRCMGEYEKRRARTQPRRAPSGELVLDALPHSEASRQDGPRFPWMADTRRLSWGAATLAAAAVLALLLLPRGNTEQFWLPVDSGIIQLRSVDATASSNLREGLLAYENHRGEEAAKTLARISDGPYRELALLYGASALLNSGRPGQALAALDDMNPRAVPEPWRSEANWIRFLVLDETGRNAEAQTLLKELAMAPGDVGERARVRMDAISR